MTHSKVHDTHDHEHRLTDILQQNSRKKTDAMLLRQIREEEQKLFEEQIKQVENKRSHQYYLHQMRDLIILDPLFQDRYDVQRPGKCDCDESFENPKFTGLFQRQVTIRTHSECKVRKSNQSQISPLAPQHPKSSTRRPIPITK